MMRLKLKPSVLLIVVVLFVLSVTRQSHAQQNIQAIGHTAGRWLGYGWTKGGYHAGRGNGQFPVVKRHHARTAYVSNGLQYAYRPAYRPTIAPQPQSVYAQPTQAPSLPATVAPAPAPAEPPKPVEPPPEWLKQYLKKENGANDSQGADRSAPQPPAATSIEQPSPSDRSPFRFDDEINAPDTSDSLLEDDDDLLLLEEDDAFTYRRLSPKQQARPVVNRYKQAHRPGARFR